MKINNPYTLLTSEQAIISGSFSTHTDWDKPVFDSIKGNIRTHLRNEQDNKCCYCKRELGFDIKSVDIEHIIAKSIYTHFTFEPLNLALSCPGCNTKKGDENILTKIIKRYPTHSNNIKIIHPHYDDYDIHIKIHKNCIYEPLSKKGSHTITVCELFRIKVAEENAKTFKNRQKKASQLIASIISGTPEMVKELLKEVKRMITN